MLGPNTLNTVLTHQPHSRSSGSAPASRTPLAPRVLNPSPLIPEPLRVLGLDPRLNALSRHFPPRSQHPARRSVRLRIPRRRLDPQLPDRTSPRHLCALPLLSRPLCCLSKRPRRRLSTRALPGQYATDGRPGPVSAFPHVYLYEDGGADAASGRSQALAD
eukprot:691624-Rhodomonas_salina.1